MALATQCPFCQTTFRVAQDQLKLRGGLVRCGHCKEVFNGNDHLVAAELAQQLVVSPTPADLIAPPSIATATPSAQPSAWPPLPKSHNTSRANTSPNLPPAADAPPAAPAWLAPANLSATFASIAAETSDAPWGAASTDNTNPPAAPAKTAIVNNAEDATTGRISETPVADPISINTLTQELSFPIPLTSSAPQEDSSQASADAAALNQALNELAADTGDNAPGGLLKQPARIDGDSRDHNDQSGASRQPDVRPEQAAAEPSNEADKAQQTPHLEAEAAAQHDIEHNADDAAEEDGTADEIDTPGFVQRAERRARLRRITGILMAIGAVLLSITLLLQALYLWRNQVAARLPSALPLLSAVCAKLHCSVGLPTSIEQLSLESNELQLLPPNQNIYALTVLLRNRGTSAQAWPYMELTLNDNDEKAITRRVFTPREYLNATQQVNAGFAGNSEQQVKLTFELSQPVASGYRIYLFFP